MPDLTKCSNDDCHLAYFCFRVQASDGEDQEYRHFEPRKEDKTLKLSFNEQCEHFQEIR